MATRTSQAVQQASEESGIPAPVPNPLDIISSGLRKVTGAGIVKDTDTGTDEVYDIEPDPVTGQVLPGGTIKTTGDMAKRSIQQQTTPVSFDEFKQKLTSGEIPTVGKMPQGKLANLVELVEMDDVPDDVKAKHQNTLQSFYEFYTEDQPAVTPVEFGTQTEEGEFVFTPTEEAKQDPKLLTVQQKIFEGKKAVAQVVSGAFSDIKGPNGEPLDQKDQSIIQRIFVRNISTGSFWDNLVEKVYEGAVVGTAVYLPDVIINYGIDAAMAGAKTAGSNLLNVGSTDTGVEFIEEWNKGSADREKASAWWANVVEDNLAIRQLSTVMNDMVASDLKRQLDAGEIDNETYERLTAPQTTTLPGGVEATTEPRYITEDMAQVLLNESIDKLTKMENYGLVLAEATLTMAGAGKLRQSTGSKDLNSVQKQLKRLEDKANAPDATAADKETFAKYAGMSPVNAGVAMKMEGEIKNFNVKAATYALDMDKVSGNMKKILNEKDDISSQMADLRANGVSKLSAQYRALEAEQRRLTGMTVQTYLTGRFVPNIKENFKAAAPLSMFMYAAGENDTLRDYFGGDRLAAEGIGALTYMVAGRPVALLAGKGAYWVNQQGGDLVNTGLKTFESIVSLPFSAMGFNGIKGYLSDGNMKKAKEVYRARTGEDMPADVQSALMYVGRVGAALDDDGLEYVVSSMEKTQKRNRRMLDSFAPEDRPKMEKILAQEFALTSGIGWIQAANRLAGLEVNARDAGSLKHLSEQVQNQRLIQNANTKTARLVMRLKEMTADKTTLTDPGEVDRYIQALEATNRASIEELNASKARLNQQINDFRDAVITNPSTPLPAGIVESLDEMEISLLDEGLDMLEVLESQYRRNTQLLADRAENISLFRRNDVQHIKQTARNFELSYQNRLKTMKDKARVGFISVDKKAADMGVSIPINKMITDLMEYAPEGDGLGAFFSKDSRFFVGTLGKQVYRVANSMAKRSLEGLEGSSYDDLYRLHTNPSPEAKKYYLGKEGEVTPLDIMTWYMDPKNQEDFGVAAPEFLATPGEVMDVYAAFRDYAVRTGDDALASRYEDYSNQVEDVIRTNAPDLFKEWQSARETYQAEWFDKLRAGGPLTKLHKSQNGPVKAIEKIDDPLAEQNEAIEQGETIFFENIAVGEEISPEVMSDRLFTVAYKTDTPIDVFDPMIKNVEKALRGDDDALGSLIKTRNQLIEEFSDITLEKGREFVFDLTSEQGLNDFKLLSGNLEELVYAKWGKNITSGLKERLTTQVATAMTGGYNFEASQNLNQLQEIFTVTAKIAGKDQPVKVKLIDFGAMIQEENSLSNIINRAVKEGGAADSSDMEILEAYKGYSTKVKSKLNESQATIIANKGIQDEGTLLVSKFLGETSPQQFFERMVVNGDPAMLDSFVNTVKSRLGDTFTGRNGASYNTEEVLDRGISYLITNGMMQYAGYAPVQGAKSVGMNGKEFTNHAMYNPEMLVAAFENDNVKTILSRYMDREHQQFIMDMAETLSEEQEYLRRSSSIMESGEPRIKGIVNPMTPGNIMARGFNLARRMVSPQYVAAEIGVNLALQSGLNLMKLAAGNKEAADIMLRLIKFPQDMTKKDLDTFTNMVTDFAVTELGQLGSEGTRILEEQLAIPTEEN